MEKNRPRGREKFVSGKSASVSKKDKPLDFGGPVGNTNGYYGRTQNEGVPHQRKRGASRAVRTGGGGCGFVLVLILAYLLLGGNNGVSQILPGVLNELLNQQVQTYAGENGGSYSQQTAMQQAVPTAKPTALPTVSNSFSGINSAGTVNTAVSGKARPKFTSLRGNGKDTVTVMVYMCGTDLESKYGMATNDLNEMLRAGVSDQINLIVETGGCKKWQNSVISNSTNQRYKIQANGLVRLENKLGSKLMTDENTLTSFIRYCAENYPADRYMLIMWDHGGGSVTGYGYDELYGRNGSMTLDRFGSALKKAGVRFDFIGFDACLMATLETCVTCEPYADYLIASEETEPGVGWYYTDWLKMLSRNTSTSTVTLGKQIIDSFVETCYRNSPSDKTTLSIVDLAEFSGSVPSALTGFASSAVKLVNSGKGKTVLDARAGAREFSRESRLDQVDLIDLANRIGTGESKELARTLSSVIKYNRTSRSMTEANGISVYFPYRKTAAIPNAMNVYDAIGMNDEYKKCVQSYASLVTGAQTAGYASGNTGASSVFEALFGSGYGESSGTPAVNADALFGGLFGNAGSGTAYGNSDIAGIIGSLLSENGVFGGRNLKENRWLDSKIISENAGYISEKSLKSSDIAIRTYRGHKIVSVPEQCWENVTDVVLNVFFDDGKGGYIDLGMDNVLSYDEEDNLLAEYDGTWIALDGHIVPYYWIDTSESSDGEAYCIRGYVPALFSGTRIASDTGEEIRIENQRVEIMLVFDDADPKGKVAGLRPVYKAGETAVMAKGGIPVENGDTFTFICDYYNRDGSYQASYELDDPMTVNGDIAIENYAVDGGGLIACYRFTDTFGNELWTSKF